MSDNKNTFIQSFQMKLGEFASAMSANIYVTAIRDAMLAYVPFTFIASIFLILACFPVEGFNYLISSILHCEAAVWQGKLLYVHSSSLAIGGLLVSMTMAHSIAEKMKLNEIQITVTSVVNYLILTPMVSSEAGNAISLNSVSAEAMFCAILTGIFTAKIYQIIDSKGIKIKMPEAVPPAVSAPFESLIPSFGAIVVFWAVRLIMDAMGTNAVAFINGTLGMPLFLIGGSIFGIVGAKIFEQLLWFFGLHGGSIVSGVMTPVLQVLEDQNRNLSMMGQMPTNIISSSFYSHFASVGVVGGVVAALLVAKRSKASGKSSLSIPLPLSIIFILFNPPSLTSTIIFDAPASHEFSINSFTTLKGFSTTSPAAILEATSGDSLFITDILYPYIYFNSILLNFFIFYNRAKKIPPNNIGGTKKINYDFLFNII